MDPDSSAALRERAERILAKARNDPEFRERLRSQAADVLVEEGFSDSEAAEMLPGTDCGFTCVDFTCIFSETKCPATCLPFGTVVFCEFGATAF